MLIQNNIVLSIVATHEELKELARQGYQICLTNTNNYIVLMRKAHDENEAPNGQEFVVQTYASVAAYSGDIPQEADFYFQNTGYVNDGAYVGCFNFDEPITFTPPCN